MRSFKDTSPDGGSRCCFRPFLSLVILSILLVNSIVTALEGPKKRAVQGVSPSLNQLPNWRATKDPKLDPYASDKLGVHVPSLTESLTCGLNGPSLLMDKNLIQVLATMDNERIPERIVHAKGGGAHGYFEVTSDLLSKYTKAALFSKVGKRTQVVTRFSNSFGESGSADSVRDNRGMAIKFYTEEGNWNFVGFAIPVLHFRDPIFCLGLVRSAKRNPQTHLHDYNALFDYFSSRPESTLNTFMTFSDIGIPNGFRFMDNFGIHTFELIDKNGKVSYCRFNWIHDQVGKSFLNQTEGVALAGLQPDYFIQDLYDAIARYEYPSWTLYVQLLTVEQAQNHPTNVFDVTKTLSEKDFPMHPVGKLYLNRNPSNFFNEVEQAAFCPGDLVPGIQMSPLDNVFHARSFAYRDTQRHRLGPNFDQLPINRPKNFNENQKQYSYERDGPCNSDNFDGGPNFFPNSFGGPAVDPKAAHVNTLGLVQRDDAPNKDDFSQPIQFLEEMKPDEFQRFIFNLSSALARTSDEIVEKLLAVYSKVSVQMVKALRDAITGARIALRELGVPTY